MTTTWPTQYHAPCVARAHRAWLTSDRGVASASLHTHSSPRVEPSRGLQAGCAEPRLAVARRAPPSKSDPTINKDTNIQRRFDKCDVQQHDSVSLARALSRSLSSPRPPPLSSSLSLSLSLSLFVRCDTGRSLYTRSRHTAFLPDSHEGVTKTNRGRRARRACRRQI